MMSTTARYPIKPKTLTLLEVCQSINEFHHPPPSISSYQYQSSLNAAQILTRRLYLHPLTINPNSKQPAQKISTTTIPSPDSEQRHQLNSEKNRETHHKKTKSSHRGLAILSSSFPLTSRINPKPDTRHFRDKASIHTDDDTNSEYDVSAIATSFKSSLPSIARGTLSSTHTKCTRPSCVMNRGRMIYRKPNRLEKVNVWHHLDRTLQRPIPLDPPTTPRRDLSDINIENDERQNHYLNL